MYGRRAYPENIGLRRETTKVFKLSIVTNSRKREEIQFREVKKDRHPWNPLRVRPHDLRLC